jgi:hypothetical protein
MYKNWTTFNLRPQVKYDCHRTDFHETRAFSNFLKNNFYLEFHENPTNGLVAAARSQTGEGSVSSYRTENNVAYKDVTYVFTYSVCQFGQILIQNGKCQRISVN